MAARPLLPPGRVFPAPREQAAGMGSAAGGAKGLWHPSSTLPIAFARTRQLSAALGKVTSGRAAMISPDGRDLSAPDLCERPSQKGTSRRCEAAHPRRIQRRTKVPRVRLIAPEEISHKQESFATRVPGTRAGCTRDRAGFRHGPRQVAVAAGPPAARPAGQVRLPDPRKDGPQGQHRGVRLHDDV